MKKNSLVYKLIITFSGILAVILITLAIALSLWLKSYFLNQQQDEFDKQAVVISSAAKEYLTTQENTDLEKLDEILILVSGSTDSEILVADRSGFAYSTSSEGTTKSKTTNIGISEEDMSKLKDGQTVKEGNLPRLTSSQIAYLKPIVDENNFSGVIVMITSKNSIDPSIKNAYRIVWICVLLAVIISGAIIAFVAKKLIINPINDINSAAKKLAKGDVERRVEVKSRDEIGELAESFNIMADSLEKVDNNRREFISNVSHELRSPITSIKGFISGILDGVIPRDKENYYLNVVHDEVNRLARLVNELLDISAMEAGKFKLNIAEIDINALIKLCLVNLEGKITSKELNVDVVLVNKHQFVNGDMDRIIQVITNLVDNAIKYTDKDGYIKIDTKVKANKVYVSIWNNGPEMTEEQIIHIWDRFYKSDKSRTNKESTGLGLPIVRLILTQHGEDIWVKNVKEGVEFTFTLTTI